MGQFWHLHVPFADVAIDDFADFDAPGWGKVAWALRVEPYGAGSVVTFELRTDATDDDAWRRQQRYFHVVGPISQLVRGSVMTHLEAQLGRLARPDDADVKRRGDALLPDARYALDHGVDIEAPPALVWPWLMQLGCDRGGWYSLDALDHDHQPSVGKLLPEWRTRAVGDRLAITPEQASFYTVRLVEPERAFVIGGEGDRLTGHAELTWEWAIEPLGTDACHLATRIRARGAPRWSAWLQGAVVFPPLHAIMQRAQLHNLKRLAEAEAQARRC